MSMDDYRYEIERQLLEMPEYNRNMQDYSLGNKILPDTAMRTQMAVGRDARNYDVNQNQKRMRQWAAPVKQQNKQAKNAVIDNTQIYPESEGYSGREQFADKTTRPAQFRTINKGQQNVQIRQKPFGPVGALPVVAPEAVGMIGAAQEAQRQGVNPMVHWMQRMTPVPIVQPTGNGGEVYNHQTNERYTPMY